MSQYQQEAKSLLQSRNKIWLDTRRAFFSNTGFSPHWLDTLSNEDYHADKTFISSTPIKKIVEKSLLTFQSSYFDPDPDPDETEAKQLGSVAHRAILEPDAFAKYKVAPDFGNLREKLPREKKKAWYEEHKHMEIVDQKQLDKLRWMVDSVLKHPDAVLMLQHAVVERSGFYRDPETGIRCKVRPDIMVPELGILADLKTTTDASYHAFQKKMWNFRYDLSMGMYKEGIKLIDNIVIENAVFIVVESVKPFECAVYEMDEEALDIGNSDYHFGLRALRTALVSNEWPGIQQNMQSISLPSYAKKRI